MADPEQDEPPGNGADSGGQPDHDLPEDVLDRVEQLTRRVREAVDENERDAYRSERDDLLADHGYAARVREDDTGATLVCYPDAWTDDDGVVQLDAVEDTDRAVERSLSGTGSDEDWNAIDAHNSEIARRVRDRHGDVHGANAEAFATFVSNHYAKPVEKATAAERREFLTEYFPRNAWPTAEQEAAVERSLELVDEAADSE